MVLPLTAYKFPSWFGDDLDFYSLLSLRVWTTFYVAQRERLLICNEEKNSAKCKNGQYSFKKRFVLHYEEFKEPWGIYKNKRSTEIPHLFCENAYWMRLNGAATKTGNSRPISWGAVGFNYRVVFCLRRAHWAWLGQISLGSKVNTIQCITCGRLLM